MTNDFDQLPARPRPQPSAESQPYWDALRAHRLILQRCTQCRRVRHYPRPLCPSCYAFDYDWVDASGRGTVHSWTVSHHAFDAAFKAALPYATVTVDLDEGVRLQAPLQGGDAAQLRIGLPVVIDFEDVDADLTLPCVRIAR